MGAGERGQPPRKRLKASRTLFDFGIKRGHEEPTGKGSLQDFFQLSSGHQEAGPCSGASQVLWPSAHKQKNKIVTPGSERGRMVEGADIDLNANQRVGRRFLLEDGAVKQQVRLEAATSLPSSRAREQVVHSFQLQATPNLAGQDLLPTTGPKPGLERLSEVASLARSSNSWPSNISGDLQSSASPARPFKPDPRKVPRVPGLQYSLDFVSKQEERYIIGLLDSGRFKWRTDIARRTLHFGHNYVYSKRPKENGTAAPPIPPELAFITERMVAAGVYTQDEAPTVLIVNEYVENQGIAAHVDKFEFSNTVVSISLNSGCWMRFHELDLAPGVLPVSIKNNAAPKTGRVEEVWLEPRSILVLQDDARIRWQHEIAKNKKGRPSVGFRRLSLTYRTRKRIGPDKSGRA